MTTFRSHSAFASLRIGHAAMVFSRLRPLLVVLVGSLCSMFLSAREPIQAGESLAEWRFFQPVALPEDIPAGCKWVDFVLQPSVFDGARLDLADLRLYDASGKEIPYALRVLQPQDRHQPIAAREFNRLTDRPDEHEVSLELLAADPEHNMVALSLSGMDFRRQATIEGSDDGSQWRMLAKGYLMRFNIDGQLVERTAISYPPSRFKYVRVRVRRDQYIDNDAPGLGAVEVLHRVKLPGEIVMWDAKLHQREPIRHDRGPASAWIIELGGKQVPCRQLELTIDDPEFVRDYELQVWNPNPRPYEDPFVAFHSSMLYRKAGHTKAPIVIQFSELAAERLRLVVVDHRNEPLRLQAVRYGGPARQVVFPWSKDLAQPLRLYYGNLQADAPYYDFARTLPTDLEPTPARAALAQREDNPEYVPPRLPLTERLRWLIYVVLGSVSVVLAGLIVGVGRQTIALRDAANTAEPEA